MLLSALPILTALTSFLAADGSPAAAPVFRVFRQPDDRLVVWDPRPELGVGVHGLPEHHARLIRDVGLRLIRKTMYWYQIETTEDPGRYDPAALAEWDATVALCERYGLALLVVVHGNAPGCGFANREESYRRFARFVADMARRYRSIRYWELWNEMDVGFTDLFGARDDVPMLERGRLYAEMLKLAYPAIREANPDAWVLTGGIAQPWGDFVRGIYEGGGREFFDIMNIHTYGVPVSWAFLGRGLACREIIKRHGDADKPLWNTEFGLDAGNLVQAWGYPHDRQPPQDDGDYFDQEMIRQYGACLDAAREQGLYQKVFAYQFHAGNECKPEGIEDRARLPEGRTLDDYGFGWLRRDGETPRPVYDWLRELDFNAPLRAQAAREVTVEYPLPGDWRPIGHETQRRDVLAAIEGVRLDSLYPAAIALETR